MLKALLVDDEPNNLENLAFMIENDCEGISVIGKATSGSIARELLSNTNVDVIFLDIQMPNEDGFQFLTSLGKHSYKIIFVTAHNEYAIKAIKANALDYILKPINVDELNHTINKLTQLYINDDWKRKEYETLEILLDQIKPNKYSKRLALHQLGSICYIDIDEIVSLQADSNYTIIHLNNLQKMVFSKTLKDFEEMLDPKQFARIHKSYMVNLHHVKEYKSTDGGMVKMSDGNLWSISRRQLDDFLAKMK